MADPVATNGGLAATFTLMLHDRGVKIQLTPAVELEEHVFAPLPPDMRVKYDPNVRCIKPTEYTAKKCVTIEQPPVNGFTDAFKLQLFEKMATDFRGVVDDMTRYIYLTGMDKDKIFVSKVDVICALPTENVLQASMLFRVRMFGTDFSEDAQRTAAARAEEFWLSGESAETVLKHGTLSGAINLRYLMEGRGG